MRPFRERLKEAAKYARVEYSQTAIARSLGISKQTVDQWMAEGSPSAAMTFRISDKWGVSARWLATEEGSILQAPPSGDLDPQEQQLITQFRMADPRWQLSIRLLSALSVEDQVMVAGDVNMVVARILGMKPRDLRYPSDEDVAKKLGKAKHVLEREAREANRK